MKFYTLCIGALLISNLEAMQRSNNKHSLTFIINPVVKKLKVPEPHGYHCAFITINRRPCNQLCADLGVLKRHLRVKHAFSGKDIQEFIARFYQ